jgi:hypothetical protein
MLQTLSGLFFVVDMLPGSPLSGHLPLVAFFLSGPLSLSLVVFLLLRSVWVHCLYLLLCFFYYGRFAWYLPVGPLTVTRCCSNSKSTPVVAAGIDRTFAVPMVTLTLSVVDGLVDTVDYCCCSCCPPQWTSNLISSSLGTFWFVVMDGHNGTVRISSASCVVATIALPLL